MNKKSEFSSLVHPSYSSVMVGIVIVSWLVLSSVWSVAKSVPFVSEYLNDSSIQSTAIVEASGGVSAVATAIFSDTIFNQIVFIGMWSLVGVLCYFLFALALMGLTNFKVALSVSKKSAFSSNGLYRLQEIGLRLAFRILMAIGLIFGLITLFQAIIPVASLTMKAGSPFDSVLSILYVVIGAVLTGLYLHLLLIMLRLFFLKVRLFNMADETVLNS